MIQCVFCGKSQDLNTQLAITLDGGVKATVSICDEHSEDATVKTAREAYLEKQKKIDEVLAQAKLLGFDLSNFQQQGSLMVPVASKTQQPPLIQIADSQQTVTEELIGDNVISTDRLDNVRGMTSVGGSTEMGAVSSYQNHNVGSLQDKLPPEVLKGKAKMVMVEARTGTQIAIAETRIDGTGTTHIKVSKKEDDSRLQQRFKRMANDSMHGHTPNFAREGYSNSQSDCPICRGTCTVKQNVGGVVRNTVCPKCHGAGFISLI